MVTARGFHWEGYALVLVPICVFTIRSTEHCSKLHGHDAIPRLKVIVRKRHVQVFNAKESVAQLNRVRGNFNGVDETVSSKVRYCAQEIARCRVLRATNLGLIVATVVDALRYITRSGPSEGDQFS